MDLLHALAAVLLPLVGYSSGVVLAGKTKDPLPSPLDLVVVIGLVATVLLARDSRLEAFALLIGFLTGAGAGALRGALLPRQPTSARRTPAATILHRPDGTPASGWHRWREFAVRFGNFQSRIIMGFFYFLVVPPFALLSRLTRDPVGSRRSGESFWLERPPAPTQLDRARSQF